MAGWQIFHVLLIAYGILLIAISSDKYKRGQAIIIFFAILLILSPFVFNDTLPRTWVSGKVKMVHKGGNIEVSASIGQSPSLTVKKEDKILEEYEVAVLPDEEKEVVIFSNDNSIYNWKWNRRAIQIQLQPDKRYRFLVVGLVGQKNIVKIEKLK